MSALRAVFSSTNIPHTGSFAMPVYRKCGNITPDLYKCKKYNTMKRQVITMPFKLDDYDISILKVLLKDGRKSFRQISRETGITTPTVKARFQRLVNIGLIKSISPIIDFEKIDYANNPELHNISFE